MRKLLVSVLVASGLTLTGVSSFAADEPPQGAETEQQMEQPTTNQEAAQYSEIKGEVTNVTEGNVEVKDESGKTHQFNTTGLENADDFEASPLQPGDMVLVKVESGKATSIERVEGDDQAFDDQASAEDPAEEAGEEMSDEGIAKEEHSQDADSMKQDTTQEDISAAETAPEAGDEELSSELEQGSETAANGEYIVKEGDTLAEIAEEQLGSQEKWGLLARANDIDNPDEIHVGQRLTIPSESEIESDEFNQENPEQAPEEMRQDEPATDDFGSPSGSY